MLGNEQRRAIRSALRGARKAHLSRRHGGAAAVRFGAEVRVRGGGGGGPVAPDVHHGGGCVVRRSETGRDEVPWCPPHRPLLPLPRFRPPHRRSGRPPGPLRPARRAAPGGRPRPSRERGQAPLRRSVIHQGTVFAEELEGLDHRGVRDCAAPPVVAIPAEPQTFLSVAHRALMVVSAGDSFANGPPTQLRQPVSLPRRYVLHSDCPTAKLRRASSVPS